MKLIVGLGNYPEKYKYTRHNIGFLTLQQYAKRLNLNWKKGIFKPYKIAKVNDDVFLILPFTYMNNVGKVLLDFLGKVNLKDILLICDDVNLPWLKLRLRFKGSSGGHRGLESIFSALQSQDVPRLRMGVGRPKDGDMVEYVLSEFSSKEMKDLPYYLESAFATIEKWIQGNDPNKLMSLVNDDRFVMSYIGGKNG